MLTRKHFEGVAAAVRVARREVNAARGTDGWQEREVEGALEALEIVSERLADYLTGALRFDRERFLAACRRES